MTIEASTVIASVVAMIIEASAVIASVVAMIIEASAVITSVVAAASVVVAADFIVVVGRPVAVAGFIVIGDVVIGSRFMESIAWLAITPMINCCCSIRSPFGYCSVVSCSALVSLVYYPYNIFTVSSTIPL